MRLSLVASLFALALACATPLRAHDTYEVTMTATIRPATMELVLTFAGATALRLTDAPPLRAPLTPEQFTALRPKLAAVAEIVATLRTAVAAGRDVNLNALKHEVCGGRGRRRDSVVIKNTARTLT